MSYEILFKIIFFSIDRSCHMKINSKYFKFIWNIKESYASNDIENEV